MSKLTPCHFFHKSPMWHPVRLASIEKPKHFLGEAKTTFPVVHFQASILRCVNQMKNIRCEGLQCCCCIKEKWNSTTRLEVIASDRYQISSEKYHQTNMTNIRYESVHCCCCIKREMQSSNPTWRVIATDKYQISPDKYHQWQIWQISGMRAYTAAVV